LTKIRNAVRVKKSTVNVCNSSILREMTNILHKYGYIESFSIRKDENNHDIMEIKLKYNPVSPINEIKRISKPGRRVYSKCEDIPKVLNGLGIMILSTSLGIMTDKEARKRNIGGELLCHVF
jgi:small subunit ribosomal protein S8